jgi:hypothetical protein
MEKNVLMFLFTRKFVDHKFLNRGALANILNNNFEPNPDKFYPYFIQPGITKAMKELKDVTLDIQYEYSDTKEEKLQIEQLNKESYEFKGGTSDVLTALLLSGFDFDVEEEFTANPDLDLKEYDFAIDPILEQFLTVNIAEEEVVVSLRTHVYNEANIKKAKKALVVILEKFKINKFEFINSDVFIFCSLIEDLNKEFFKIFNKQVNLNVLLYIFLNYID